MLPAWRPRTGQDAAVLLNVRDPFSPRLRRSREGIRGRCRPWPWYGRARSRSMPTWRLAVTWISPPGVPVVRRVAGVMVWLPALCPGGGRLAEDLRAQAAVRAL